MPKNLGGHVTLATPPFGKNFKGSCPDCPWEHARQILNSVALTALNWSDRSAAHRHTHIEWKQYLCHSLHSLGGDNYVLLC